MVEEKSNDTERIIANLKNQLQEARKVENNLEQQLKKRKQELEKYEAELVLLGKKIDEESFQSKFVSNSKTLDDILSCQRSSSNKTGLYYGKGMKLEQSSPTIQDGNTQSYADVLQDLVEKGDSKKSASFQNERRTNKIPRRPVTN